MSQDHAFHEWSIHSVSIVIFTIFTVFKVEQKSDIEIYNMIYHYLKIHKTIEKLHAAGIMASIRKIQGALDFYHGVQVSDYIILEHLIIVQFCPIGS